MISAELLSLPKQSIWQPAMTLRPHHFFFTEVQDALKGKLDVEVAAYEEAFRYRQRLNITGDPAGYYNDLVGKSSGEIGMYIGLVEDFYAELSNLKDVEVVQLDLTPDKSCKRCVFGRHCTGTNYESMQPPRDTVEVENEKVSEITNSLVKAGFKEGFDFVYKPTKHTLYDFHGNKLNTSMMPTPVQVEFNSMLAKVYALRGIAA
jgi:hypothetical protein